MIAQTTGIPLGDPQFWVVTGVVAAVLAFAGWRAYRGSRRKKSTRVRITVERNEAAKRGD
tara:strand:- start:156 stop:335 length:180 start_codon:yes stop_codon:yes gene_type:complete